ncbi:MAG: hypothetical protein WCV93_06115 [Candidatus Shapirobacteria bacterium]
MSIKRIAAIFLALMLVLVLFFLMLPKIRKNSPPINIPSGTPSIEEQIKEKFKGLEIPVDAEKVELKNVSEEPGMGIATRNEVLADLPTLKEGENYQVLISNGSKTILLGTMRQAKGGYLLEYDSSKYSGYNQIIIVKGSVHILEGSF